MLNTTQITPAIAHARAKLVAAHRKYNQLLALSGTANRAAIAAAQNLDDAEVSRNRAAGEYERQLMASGIGYDSADDELYYASREAEEEAA